MNREAPDANLDRLGQQLREDIQASAVETRRYTEARVAAAADETRRHAETLVAEGILSKVQLVAEGLALLDQKVERFRDEVRNEFSSVDQHFLRLEGRISTLERR